MFCINCFHGKTETYNSRPSKKNASVWRRRRCKVCDYDFTTVESVDVTNVYKIIGSDGSKSAAMPFSRATLTLSLLEVLTYAGADKEDAFWLEQTIEQQLIKLYRPKDLVKTADIATATFSCLQSYNQLAALAYASRHGLAIPKPGRPRKN